MARPRKRHLQLELGATTRTWGGKRKGAGRLPKGRRPGERHRKRERFDKPRVAHPPRSWLLAVGWKKAGPISMYDVPGGRVGLGAPPGHMKRRTRRRA